MLVVDALPASVREQVSSRLRRADLARWLAQVEQVGHCAKPIRLVGTSDTINPVTGEVPVVVLLEFGAGSGDVSAVRQPASGGVSVVFAPVPGRRVSRDHGRCGGWDEGRAGRGGWASVDLRDLDSTLVRAGALGEETRPWWKPAVSSPFG